jgi:biotin-dependent carboxylase-like uncharacterized protein
MTGGPALEVRSPGAYASIQDAGRRGYRRLGVPWAGVLDPRLMRLANALAGRPGDSPVIECFDGGFQVLALGGPMHLAVAGHVELEIRSGGGARGVPAWSGFDLAPGEVLRLRRMVHGRLAMVAVAGLAMTPVLGSCATYARAGLGGLAGRPLAAGDRLPVLISPQREAHFLLRPPGREEGPIRVVPGPQAEHFPAEVRAGFLAAAYRVAAAADRMGIRLEGPALAHLGPAEIVSDATVPGSIQVPGNGQPIVLLADAQTAGGYPKIATVISADLPRLAALGPGDEVRFAPVSVEEAQSLARRAESATRELLASIRPQPRDGVDLPALYAANLVGGVVDALGPDPGGEGGKP